MSKRDSYEKVVRDRIASRESPRSQVSFMETSRKWAIQDIEFENKYPSDASPALIARAQATIDDIDTALALVKEYEDDIAARQAACATVFNIGQKVRMIEEQINWTNETVPHVGLVGVVADPKEYPYPQDIEGRIPVRVRLHDVGFVEDEDDDEIRNSLILQMHNFTLELAEDDAVSAPYNVPTYQAHPAPEGHRWAIILTDGSELLGHQCPCYGAMKEYADPIGWEVKAVPMGNESAHFAVTV